MLKRIEPSAAAEVLLSQPVSHRCETVALTDALGRVLAEDIHAAFPMPPFDKSPFDGFAFRAEDVPGRLPIVGSLPAGTQTVPPLTPGTATRIYTGAPVPVGANAVCKFEETVDEGTYVTISRSFAPNKNVIAAGEDYPGGAILAEKGVHLSPAHLGQLASQGINAVKVFRKPRAAVIVTGTELSEPGTPRPAYGIYNSNAYTVAGYLQQMGFTVDFGGIVEDDPQRITETVQAALDADTDLVVTTGGASVGDYDYALTAAENLQADILFWKVRMKPGGALLASVKNGKVLLSLSGNPAAALTSLLTVVQPFLRKLTGASGKLQVVQLPLGTSLTKDAAVTRFLRGHMAIENGTAYFQENDGQGNGMMASFANCDMIGIIPPDSGTLEAGAMISALALPRDLF